MDKLGPYQLNSIITGDAKILAKEIPDESVDLVFTDPEYDKIEDYEWLGKISQRILKRHGHLLVYVTQEHLPMQLAALDSSLNWAWLFGIQLFGRRAAMWQKKIQACGQMIAWYARSGFNHSAWADDFIGVNAREKRGHPWRKGIQETAHYLQAFSNPHDLIVDFFGGGGTTSAVCKMFSRNYLAFEINPEIAELARQRVAQTKVPLFVLEPEQTIMELKC